VKRAALILPLLISLAASCTEPPPPAPPPQPPPPAPTAAESAEPAREAPPPSGTMRPFQMPRAAWSELPGGLRVGTLVSKALPLVQIRVIVGGGKAFDGERPGLASLTAQLLKDGGAGNLAGRDLVTRVAELGADLHVETGSDATYLSLAVTRDQLDAAMDLLGAVVVRPRMAADEFKKLQKRSEERLADAARTSGTWGAQMVLHKDLFNLPAEHHPYASYGPTASDVARITLADCRAYHKRTFVPKNTIVIVAGDTTPEAAQAAVKRAFSGYKGGEPPSLSFTDPEPIGARKITVVDRPRSSQSDVFVAALGPDRADKRWAAFAVANQILGGGVSGRLFLDVREKRSLAYGTRSGIAELSHGPSVLTAYAGTQTAKTGLALQGLLENLEKLATIVPADAEAQDAARYLVDSFAVKLETIGAVADEVVRLRVLGLPEDWNEGYRKELRDITAPLALKAASDFLRPGREVIVVAGDAAVVGPMLSHYGEVKVVDPTRDFARVRTIPMNAEAPLEVPRPAGK
jgi:predicted Zn-dependent peptidase